MSSLVRVMRVGGRRSIVCSNREDRMYEDAKDENMDLNAVLKSDSKLEDSVM